MTEATFKGLQHPPPPLLFNNRSGTGSIHVLNFGMTLRHSTLGEAPQD